MATRLDQNFFFILPARPAGPKFSQNTTTAKANNADAKPKKNTPFCHKFTVEVVLKQTDSARKFGVKHMRELNSTHAYFPRMCFEKNLYPDACCRMAACVFFSHVS